MATTITLPVNGTWLPDRTAQLYVAEDEASFVAAEGGRIRVLKAGVVTLEYLMGATGPAGGLMRNGRKMIPVGHPSTAAASPAAAAPPAPARPGMAMTAPSWESVILTVIPAPAVAASAPGAVALPPSAAGPAIGHAAPPAAAAPQARQNPAPAAMGGPVPSAASSAVAPPRRP